MSCFKLSNSKILNYMLPSLIRSMIYTDGPWFEEAVENTGSFLHISSNVHNSSNQINFRLDKCSCITVLTPLQKKRSRYCQQQLRYFPSLSRRHRLTTTPTETWIPVNDCYAVLISLASTYFPLKFVSLFIGYSAY